MNNSIFDLVVINPTNRSLKTDFRLDYNASFYSLYIIELNQLDRKREHVTFWNSKTRSTLFGQIKDKIFNSVISKVHYLIIEVNSLGHNVLVKCSGCNLNDFKPICILKVPFKNLVKVDILSNTPTSSYRSPKLSLFELDFLAKTKVFSVIRSPLTPIITNPNILPIINEQFYSNLLSEIAVSLSTTLTLSFYTDGSLINPTTDNCKMGIG